MEKFSWKILRIQKKKTENKQALDVVNQIVNEKKLTKKQLCLILTTLIISEIMVISPDNIENSDFQPDWLLKELDKTNIFKKEFWKAKLSSLRKEQ